MFLYMMYRDLGLCMNSIPDLTYNPAWPRLKVFTSRTAPIGMSIFL